MTDPTFEVAVRVRLYEAKSGEALKDYSEVVAWIVPVRTLQTASLNADRPHYHIMQHDKYLSLICWWSRWQVSSNFRIAIPGFTMPSRYPAVMFCNIHPQVAAVVLTVESPYFGVSDKTDHISIGNVPAGTYVLHVWYEHAPSRTLQTLHRAIVLGDDHSCMSTLSIKLGKRVHDC